MEYKGYRVLGNLWDKGTGYIVCIETETNNPCLFVGKHGNCFTEYEDLMFIIDNGLKIGGTK